MLSLCSVVNFTLKASPVALPHGATGLQGAELCSVEQSVIHRDFMHLTFSCCCIQLHKSVQPI